MRIFLVYCLHVLLASAAGTLPPFLYFISMFSFSLGATILTVIGPLLIASLICFGFIIFPFCFFIAAPIAIFIHQFVRLTLIRILFLALLLTAPGIIFLDHFEYASSGPDSGPPTEPYSLTHLTNSLSSPGDIFLMVILPAASALCCAFALWYVRFRPSEQ